jgi:hypothetical protein
VSPATCRRRPPKVMKMPIATGGTGALIVAFQEALKPLRGCPSLFVNTVVPRFGICPSRALSSHVIGMMAVRTRSLLPAFISTDRLPICDQDRRMRSPRRRCETLHVRLSCDATFVKASVSSSVQIMSDRLFS